MHSPAARTLTWSRYERASRTLSGRRLLFPPACCCQVGEGRFGGMLCDMVAVGAGEVGSGKWEVGECQVNEKWSWYVAGANPPASDRGNFSCLSPLLLASPLFPINLHENEYTQKPTYTTPRYRYTHTMSGAHPKKSLKTRHVAPRFRLDTR